MAINFIKEDTNSGFQSTDSLQANFSSLETLLERALSRYGDTPNTMQADLDMNSQRILNLPQATRAGMPVTYDQWTGTTSTNEFSGYTVEEQTATASQTVFTLTNAYTPGISSMRIYINGVYQAPSSYTETDANTVTFSGGLDAGDVVAFVITSFDAAGTVNASAVAYDPAGTGAVSTNVQAKLREVVSVKDFGAVGDGATDDGAAINSAITAAYAAGGGTVCFSAGTYLCEEAIVLQTNVHLVGAGIDGTVLKTKDSSNIHLITHAAAVSNVSVSKMTLDGNRANQTSGVHCLRSGAAMTCGRFYNLHIKSARTYNIGFQNGDYTDLVFDSIYLEDSGDDAIDFKNTEDGSTSIKFSNIHVNGFDKLAAGGNAGLDIRGPAYLSNIYVNFDGTTSGAGVQFRSGELLAASGFGGHRSKLTNFHVVGNAGTTIGVNCSGRDVSISNGHIENCYRDVIFNDVNCSLTAVTTEGASDYSVLINAGADRCRITGCGLETPNDVAIRVEADQCAIVGNTIDMGAGGVSLVGDNNTVVGNTIFGTGTAIGDSGTGNVATGNAV